MLELIEPWEAWLMRGGNSHENPFPEYQGASVSAIEGFSAETFTAEGRTFRLFRKGGGPGVILLHELPGLTQETVELAE